MVSCLHIFQGAKERLCAGNYAIVLDDAQSPLEVLVQSSKRQIVRSMQDKLYGEPIWSTLLVE